MLFSQISLTRHFIVMISQDYLELLNCLVRLMMRDSLHVFICVMGVLDFFHLRRRFASVPIVILHLP